LHKLSQTNGDSLNNVRSEARKTFRNKKQEIFERKKLMNLKETVRRKISNLYRGLNECKKGYQPRTNLVNRELT
jgi:hypothetical protein